MTDQPLKLDGQRALVTAGASGIGAAIANTLASHGAIVYICDIDSSALSSFLAEHDHINGSLCDVADPAQAKSLVDTASQTLSGLDILVNNAGIAGPTAAVEEVAEADWQRTLEVNINGQFYCTKYAVPWLKKAGGGSIINLSSVAGRFGFPLRTPYSASKWAVIGFTKSLAIELGPDQIRVNAVCPGAVEGPRIDRVIQAKADATGVSFEQMRESLLSNVSLRTTVSATDIANLCLFLCSKAGCRISGQALQVDGHIEVLR